jgi:hypothetical protein
MQKRARELKEGRQQRQKTLASPPLTSIEVTMDYIVSQ